MYFPKLKIKNIVKKDSRLTRLLEKYDSSVTFPFGDAANVHECLIGGYLAYQISPDSTAFRKNGF